MRHCRGETVSTVLRLIVHPPTRSQWRHPASFLPPQIAKTIDRSRDQNLATVGLSSDRKETLATESCPGGAF